MGGLQRCVETACNVVRCADEFFDDSVSSTIYLFARTFYFETYEHLTTFVQSMIHCRKGEEVMRRRIKRDQN